MAQVDVVTGARIAVLDDNRNFQNLMRTMLRHLGFRHVEVFGDPDEATTHVVEHGADLVFCDLMMPKVSGLEWARALRRSPGLANPEMAIVLVTGHAVRSVLEESIAAGIDDLLVKPLSPEALNRHTLRVLTARPSYVRVGSYYGPDAVDRRRRLQQIAGGGRRPVPTAAPTPEVASNPTPRPARPRRSVPGLDVEIVDRTSYHVDALYLD
ncbi:MAG: response regulator [Siculibacillus sp.]